MGKNSLGNKQSILAYNFKEDTVLHGEEDPEAGSLSMPSN